ncbi:EF-hand calcium-binding domain-containing protein 6 [Rhynchocyon petersi]
MANRNCVRQATFSETLKLSPTKGLRLVDVDSTDLEQPQELRRVLETCLGMQEDECNSHAITSPEDTWGNCSIEEIERIFCQELLKSHQSVEKGLSAGDTCNSGYVSLNYLKIVLDTFVYQLPRRIFLQLMKRFGLKTTAKVNWKQFLTAFYNPPWTPTRNGSITRRELRNLLNSIAVKVSDSELRELMQRLDPEATGLVCVNTFLDLLEDDSQKVEEIVRDGIARNQQAFCNALRSYDPGDTGYISLINFRKWMRTFCPVLTNEQLIKLCSKFQAIPSGRILYKRLLASLGVNGAPTTSPIAIQKDQLFSEHAEREAQLRPGVSGRSNPTKGDKTLVTRNLTKEEVSEKLRGWVRQRGQAVQRLFLDFSQDPSGIISKQDFRKVLEALGMSMDDDQYALLTTQMGFRKEGMNYLDFAARFEDSEMKPPVKLPVRTKGHPAGHFQTAEECLRLFPGRLKESFRNTYAAFFRMDTDRDGIVSMRDFHGLLQQLLFNLKEQEFTRLLELLGLRPSVTLNFREFRSLCENGSHGIVIGDPPQRLLRAKQKVTDSELACEQAHQYLVTKAKTRWTDLSKNFLETDKEGRGILRQRDIKNALYGFDIPLTPQEFEKLWTRYDTEGKGHITHQEFLQKLGVDYLPEVHQPYAEDHFNLMGHFTKPQQILEEVRELHQSTEKANSLMSCICFSVGCMLLGPPLPQPEYQPRRQAYPLYHGSQDPTGPDARKSKLARCHWANWGRDKLKEHRQDISKAVMELHRCGNGCVALNKLQKVLQEHGCPFTEEELAQLLNSLDISFQNNFVNCLDFLKAVDSDKPARLATGEKEENKPVNFASLSPEEVPRKVQEVVDSSQEALWKAFSELDKEDTGFVKAADFGQVLKDFCYKLSDCQYNYFLRKLKIHLIPRINWKYFLQNFNSFFKETAVGWAEKMPKPPLPPKTPTPKDTGKRDILAHLHKAVATHYSAITQEFENFDTKKTSTVSRDEFRAICNRHVQILTDEQFDKLWSEMPVTAKGRLQYQDFLSRFSSKKEATPDSGDSTRAQKKSSILSVPGGTRSARLSPTRDPNGRPKTRSHACTPVSPVSPPLQNCEAVESRLRPKMRSCWRELLRECKALDSDRSGEISPSHFLALAEKFKLGLSKEEGQQLLTKYDQRNRGKFAYCDFIQSCVLMLRAKETSLMQRLKIQNFHKMKEAGTETSSFYSALLRIQPKIVYCWRPMRRSFKAYDQDGTGFLSVTDFRKVLRQYSINLSEEELFHILEYYDKTLSSKISYNDFLRAFLQ